MHGIFGETVNYCIIDINLQIKLTLGGKERVTVNWGTVNLVTTVAV